MDKLVWIDIETSGLDFDIHQIVQVAMVATSFDLNTEYEASSFRVKFDLAKADESALKTNGYTEEAWRDATTQRTCISNMDMFFKRHATWNKDASNFKFAHLAGHNIALFDAPFIGNYFKRAGVKCPATVWAGGQIDTMQMARAWLFAVGEVNPSLKLSSLCARFGIELQNAHDALADIMATIHLCRKLRDQMLHKDQVVLQAIKSGGVLSG